MFGGSFDPPHNGHLALSLFARELLALDRIIISVSNNPFKQNRAATDLHRYRMTELLAREINKTGECCEVSQWELHKKQPSCTVDLIRHINAAYPQHKLTLLVGEDSFKEFPSWKEPDTLCRLADVVVFSRGVQQGEPQGFQSNAATRNINFNYPVSSTEVRELASSGKPLSRILPSSIQRYMITQGLYQSTSSRLH